MPFKNMFMEHPEGITGVTPTILSFVWASSNRVVPHTSCNKGGIRYGIEYDTLSGVFVE
jgi:hypothetical protein